MNESIDLLPFGGGPMLGRKRRALATLCILARSGFALALGLSLISDPAMVLDEFGYKQNPSGQLLVEKLAGIWVTVWAVYTIYIAGLGSVEDKKANAVMNFLGTAACIYIASQTDMSAGTAAAPKGKKAAAAAAPPHLDLMQVYIVTGVFTLITDGLTFLLCGAGPNIVRVNENTFSRLNSSEDAYKDQVLSMQNDGDVTVIKRINSHTQLFSMRASNASEMRGDRETVDKHTKKLA